MKLYIFTSLVLVLPINVIFGDFTAFFVVDFFGADVFAAEDILSNKKGCWQPGLSSVLSVTECLVASFSTRCSTLKSQLHTRKLA